MKIFTTLLLFFSWICFASTVLGQENNASITGLVVADTNKTELPLDGAVVSLFNASDSSLVKTQVTETDGRFDFVNLSAGKYFVVAVHDGYLSFSSDKLTIGASQQNPLTVNVKLPAKSAEKLDEITVKAKIPVIERKIDRTVVNVDAMITATGNNALELLKKSPGVIVDQNGTIMIKGKPGVLIYIDDKPTYLSGDALQSYLISLPASAISQIEVITNPPAKYDAAGNVGIINIVTKKGKLRGSNGNFTVNYGQGRYAKTTNSFNFNYRNYKVNIFGTLNGGDMTMFSDLYINRTYRNEDTTVKSYFNQNTRMLHTNTFGGLKLGMDIYATEKTTLGIGLNGWMTQAGNKSRNISQILDPAQNLTGTVIADNSDQNKFLNGSVNFNFRHKFDSTGKSLTMDLDYVRYDTYSKESYLNNTYSPDGILTLTDQLDGKLPAKINIYAFKADYSKPLKNDAKFDAGIKTSYTSIDNLVDYYITANGASTPDYDKSNHFKYDEMINAAYVNFSKNYKRFAFQAGLRSEGTLSVGNQLGNPVKPTAKFNRDYLSVFPTAYLSYKIDSAENNQLRLSYGRRINRPYFQDLNPFVRPLDKFTFYSGNPMLRPTFAQNLSFGYSFKSLFSVDLSYGRTRNEIQETIEIDANGLYFSRPGNIGQTQTMSISVNSTIPVAKWLSTMVYSEVTHNQYTSKLYTETLNSQGTYFYIYLNNSFTIGKGWSAELGGYYVSDVVSSQFILKSRGQLDIGVQKKILKEKGSVKVSINDMLYTAINRGVINNLRLTDANWENYSDTRVVYFTFTYAFGKPFVSKPKHEGTGAESEQQRVK